MRTSVAFRNRGANRWKIPRALRPVELLSHFRQRLRFCHMKTWWKVRQVRLLHSRCDYVPFFGPPGVWEIGDKLSEDVFVQSLCITRTATTDTDSMPWGTPDGMLRLTPYPTHGRTTKPCGHQVTRAEVTRDAPPAMCLCTHTPVDFWGVSTDDWWARQPMPLNGP